MSQSINKRHLLVNHKLLSRNWQYDTVAGVKRRCKVLLRQKCKQEQMLTYVSRKFMVNFIDRFDRLMLSVNSHDFNERIAHFSDFYAIYKPWSITVDNVQYASIERAIYLCENQLYKFLFVDAFVGDLQVIDFKKYLIYKFKRDNTGIIRDIMASPKGQRAILHLLATRKLHTSYLNNVNDLVCLIGPERVIDFLCESGNQLILPAKSRLKKFGGFINTQELLRHFSRCCKNDNIAKLIKYIRSADMEFLLAMLCTQLNTLPQNRLTEGNFAKTYPLILYIMTGVTYQFNELRDKKRLYVSDSISHTLRLENAKN